jgi:mannose-6-phosphate isomerase-like protein (cupin superfamily)
MEKCPVQKISNYKDETTGIEIAVFNQFARQDRHYHNIGTEIYMVMEGHMIIEVKGVSYRIEAGDMIVVNPLAVHEVKPSGTEFLCRVVTVNCKGDKDKYVVGHDVIKVADKK